MNSLCTDALNIATVQVADCSTGSLISVLSFPALMVTGILRTLCSLLTLTYFTFFLLSTCIDKSDKIFIYMQSVHNSKNTTFIWIWGFGV